MELYPLGMYGMPKLPDNQNKTQKKGRFKSGLFFSLRQVQSAAAALEGSVPPL